MATALAATPGKAAQPLVNLILRSPDRVRDYDRQGGALTVYRDMNGVPLEVSRAIPATDPTTLVRRLQHAAAQTQSRPQSAADLALDNLVISVKTYQTVAALSPLIPAITPQTSILLLQNGMGSYESLCSVYWPDPALRPQFYVGITTHGVNSLGTPTAATAAALNTLRPQSLHRLGNFTFTHASPGYINIAKVPVETEQPGEKASVDGQDSPLVQALLRAPGLNTHLLSYPDFVIAQVDKLVANAVINPLTALYECLNGELLALQDLDSLVYSIARECAQVFTAEFRDVLPPADLATAFSVGRFSEIVQDVIRKTAENRSSMLQDVQALRDTEIDEINGYVARLGKKHAVGALHNKMIAGMIKSKVSLARDRAKRAAPVINV